MIPCFVLQSLALRIQNGRQAYLGADWVQLHTTLLPAFWCRQDSVRSNICKYLGRGRRAGQGPSLPRFPYLDVWECIGWDSGFYPDSRISVSAIALAERVVFFFFFHFLHIYFLFWGLCASSIGSQARKTLGWLEIETCSVRGWRLPCDNVLSQQMC